MRKSTTKFVASLLAIGMMLTLATVNSYAGPSSKFSATLSSVELLPADAADPSVPVLSATLKTPNKKELLIGVSLVTGLYTKTKVASKNGVADTSEASAKLTVVVKIDGNEVFPGPVVYDERIQTLSATLGGILTECADTGAWTYTLDADGNATCTQLTTTDPVTGEVVPLPPDGKITIPCECSVSDETIELALKTTAAHHFNFVARNVTPGDHTITVEIVREIGANGDAEATALVGKGSLTVEEVRATNSPDGVIELSE